MLGYEYLKREVLVQIKPGASEDIDEGDFDANFNPDLKISPDTDVSYFVYEEKPKHIKQNPTTKSKAE